MGDRILLLGATGTIGRATCAALLGRGHAVVCPVRGAAPDLPAGAIVRRADITDPVSLRRDGIGGDRLDAVISCLASRSGRPADAWAIDHRATLDGIAAARDAGARRVVLLSAICVQEPALAFQHAKRAAEEAVRASGLAYTIVRPTAFFKSLSGQVARLRAGKPFLVFGDGRLTACKPIGDADLGAYLADCLTDPARENRILAIGGPGPALTPLDQGRLLAAALGRPPAFRHVPVALLRGIAAGLGAAGRLSPAARAKADLARIGVFYATRSMLVRDPETRRYDADATPEWGRETLADHYAALARSGGGAGLGAHAVFSRDPVTGAGR